MTPGADLETGQFLILAGYVGLLLLSVTGMFVAARCAVRYRREVARLRRKLRRMAGRRRR